MKILINSCLLTALVALKLDPNHQQPGSLVHRDSDVNEFEMSQNYGHFDEDYDLDIGVQGTSSDTISIRAKVTPKRATEAFETLTDREKNYAYFMEKASWAGAKMVLH